MHMLCTVSVLGMNIIASTLVFAGQTAVLNLNAAFYFFFFCIQRSFFDQRGEVTV